ncbi:GTPase HflX [Thermoleophilum album]|uniref:GTPase HflX n=1 Tax=Thermoleophilum album TaxID=29539 RepID=UPI00237C99DE|nr:GTPase HflX [Thermoleophilum album]WDT92783.1 GTPase HflX [Thermoleophilum album]
MQDRRETRFGEGIRNPRARQRAICIAAAPHEPDFAELRELLRTAGVAVAGELWQRRERPDPDRYLGRGKLAELAERARELGANVIACDDELLPRQERNIEAATGLAVVDRTAIILDIFARHARTAEGKLQVELAQLEYNLARMRGLWTHLERLGGGIGTRGPGESQIETDRRLARDRISEIKRKLAHIQRVRATMRAERERAALPTIALAGYTNAGKSTLMNALTGAGVSVRSRLFHTLDPTTRAFRIDGRTYLLTDTVGFIRKLPHQLVAAFAATLEETRRADLVLHVQDASVPEPELAAMLAAVERTLEEIGAAERPRLLVFNKIDLVSSTASRALRRRWPRAVAVSAESGEGLEQLRRRIAAELARGLEAVELFLPYREGARLAELFALAGQVEQNHTAEGVHVRARVPKQVAARFAPYRLDCSAAAQDSSRNGHRLESREVPRPGLAPA